MGTTFRTRPGVRDVLAYIAEHPETRTILVETANRFARDLIVQEAGFAKLKDAGIELVAVDDPDAFSGDTPTAIMVRQILGAVAQFEKASIVAKLKGARDRVGPSGASARAGKAMPRSAPRSSPWRVASAGSAARSGPSRPSWRQWVTSTQTGGPMLPRRSEA